MSRCSHLRKPQSVPLLLPSGLPVCFPPPVEAKRCTEMHRELTDPHGLSDIGPFPLPQQLSQGLLSIPWVSASHPDSAPPQLSVFDFYLYESLGNFTHTSITILPLPFSSQTHSRPPRPTNSVSFYSFLINFCFQPFFLTVYMCPQRPENSDLPVAGVIGSHELPIIMGAGNRTCVLHKSSVCS